MECKFGCHERGNLHANEHWTEAETKSDIRVENLIKLLSSKLLSWESYITVKLRTDYYNNKSQVYIMYVA